MIYEYRCPECGMVELEQSMKENALQICPQCSNRDFIRIISGGAGTHFKGKGFFVNDYKKTDSSFDKYAPRGNDEKKYF